MSEITYNILWIDDEHEGMSGFKGDAKFNGINLIPFKSLNGGMNELERNYHYYDGVLFDAKFFENEDDLNNSEDTDYVHRAKERLLQLNKKFEIFILTGQAEAYEDKTFHKAFTRVYKKGSDEEIERLFAEIKEASRNQADTQIRHKYRRVFEVCHEDYIGNEAGTKILHLLKIIEGVETDSDTENKLNSIRKVIEFLFEAFYKIGILPPEIYKGEGNINQSKLFLLSKHPNYIYNDLILHPAISYLLDKILDLTQEGSHAFSSLKIDSFIQKQSTPYLFNSLILNLLDILIWFKGYKDQHKDVEKNKKFAILSDPSFTCFEGIIEQDNKNNFYCGEYKLNYNYVQANNKLGDKIRITASTMNNDSRTNLKFPKFATKYIKID